MKISLEIKDDLTSNENLVIITAANNDYSTFFKDSKVIEYINQRIQNNDTLITINDYQKGNSTFIVNISIEQTANTRNESLRRAGNKIAKFLNSTDNKAIQLTSLVKPEDSLLVAEGIILGSYQFNKYKSKQNTKILPKITFQSNQLTLSQTNELVAVLESVFHARNLVNEPLNGLNALDLADICKDLGKQHGFEVEILHLEKIKALKMGGLVSVNLGSPNPPAFIIMEYKPNNASSKPIVLVGKGVVFDTGGLSLKDAAGMEGMKADMAGAAAVIGTFQAIAANKLPIHIIGLIPATENRPSGNALAPGDVIKIFGDKTVEVLNTDAEGRLILADALEYAAKYDPKLVIDLATLTGAAARAIGKEGMVMMGTASPEIKSDLITTGFEVHERIVEFPLWEEYFNQLKSDIADIKNIGSSEAGAITAGKFLEYFTSYPWIHLDIAGPAYISAEDEYKPKNATGTGVRLLYNFLKKQVK